MSIITDYNRNSAIEYANFWALKRNPNYFDYTKIGGDCTNFISQVLHAGECSMNFDKANGWYYVSSDKKSPSWTGTNFLYGFLINNKTQGPFAVNVTINEIEVGDIIQLNFENDFLYNHSLVITKIQEPRTYDNIFICSHSKNRLNEPLSSINFEKIRYIHLLGTLK
jgi:hypothetical protein